MYRTLLFVSLISFFVGCKKKDNPAETYTVKYECKCTPLLGATLSGTITYTTPTSATNTGTLTNNNWTFTQTQWALKKGDKINVSSTVQGNSDCTLYIYVDGAIKTFRNQVVQISGQTPTNSISLEFIAP